MQAGIRYDNETYTIENPELDIPTRRTIALIGATYHFTNPTENQNYKNQNITEQTNAR
jgi:hypothetical protein